MAGAGRIKQYNTAEPLTIKAFYDDPSIDPPLDLPLDTVARITMKLDSPGAVPTLDGETIAVVSSAAGIVTFERNWVVGETDVHGNYVMEIECDLDAGQLTIPTHGYMQFVIEPVLGHQAP